MCNFLKRLFCGHKNKKFMYVLHGDRITYEGGGNRYVYKCLDCGEYLYEPVPYSCEGCKHLCYDNAGMAECDKGVEHACFSSNRYFWEEKSESWVRVPDTGIGDLSDGYHTFNGLYYQRMILFAALVKLNHGRAWKSHLHENGEKPFGGGWFIVGIDTPEGSYTYHYEDKDWDLFECKELPRGKHWDGHTEEDVTRLLSL